ncbi:MAG: J domain-containing protein [Halobacteriales archaeon]
MLHEWVGFLPEWLRVGLLLGGLLTLVVAVVFAIGAKVFPSPSMTSPTSQDAGETRRRGEIRQYLGAIEEPYVEDWNHDGRSAAFYLPDREIAITFDAQQYFLLESADIRTILVEHEMPGAHLGSRLPFETPDLTDPDPGEIQNGVQTAFAVLGVSPSASSAELREAYRAKIKEVHPDQGGDPEAFQRVKDAYAVAKERAD